MNNAYLHTRRFFLKQTAVAVSAATWFSTPMLQAAEKAFEKSADLHILKNLYGFTGERADPVTGLYHLGQGYRVYNPNTMRFSQADHLSPFNEGGINPCMYCEGNPVNFVDPTGHSPSAIDIATNVVGIAFNIAILTVLILGLLAGPVGWAALPSMIAAVGTIAGITSGILGLAATIIDDRNPHKKNLSQASSILGLSSSFASVASAGTASVLAVRALKVASTPLTKFNAARSVFGAALEVSNTSAAIAGMAAGASGDRQSAQNIRYAQVGFGFLSFAAYTPLNFKPVVHSKTTAFTGADPKTVTVYERSPTKVGMEITREVLRSVNYGFRINNTFF